MKKTIFILSFGFVLLLRSETAFGQIFNRTYLDETGSAFECERLVGEINSEGIIYKWYYWVPHDADEFSGSCYGQNLNKPRPVAKNKKSCKSLSNDQDACEARSDCSYFTSSGQAERPSLCLSN